jgi:hypothetical protein
MGLRVVRKGVTWQEFHGDEKNTVLLKEIKESNNEEMTDAAEN